MEFHPWVGSGDEFQEVQELGVGVLVVTAVGDLPGSDLEGGEQAGRAVAGVVVSLLGGGPGAQRQDRGGPVQRLDLGFLVDTDDHRLLGRIQVQGDDVTDLGFQLGIGGERERLHPPRLQVPLPPDPGDRGEGDPSWAPSRRLDQCVTPNPGGGASKVATTTATSSCTSGRPGRSASSSPFIPPSTYRFRHVTTRLPGNLQPPGDISVRDPLSSQQHDPGPLHQARRRRRGTQQRRQPFMITITQNHTHHSRRHNPHPRASPSV